MPRAFARAISTEKPSSIDRVFCPGVIVWLPAAIRFVQNSSGLAPLHPAIGSLFLRSPGTIDLIDSGNNIETSFYIVQFLSPPHLHPRPFQMTAQKCCARTLTITFLQLPYNLV